MCLPSMVIRINSLSGVSFIASFSSRPIILAVTKVIIIIITNSLKVPTTE